VAVGQIDKADCEKSKLLKKASGGKMEILYV